MSSDAKWQAKLIEHSLSSVQPIETEIIAFKGFMLTENKFLKWDVWYMSSDEKCQDKSIEHGLKSVRPIEMKIIRFKGFMPKKN